MQPPWVSAEWEETAQARIIVAKKGREKGCHLFEFNKTDLQNVVILEDQVIRILRLADPFDYAQGMARLRMTHTNKEAAADSRAV
jgi:hypothetical protein